MRRVDLDLSDEHRLFRDTVRGFAEGVVAPVAEELDAHGRFPLAELRQAAELGLLGVPVPEADGGAGGDTLAYALCIEELARIDSSFAITVAAHTSLGTMPILLFGDERQRAEWLPQLASGERLAAFGLTEPEAGSDAGATRTTARAEDGEWVIDGSKMFITNAGTEISGCVTITARTGDDEISNFIVPNGTPGYDVGPPLKKMGWKSSDTRPLAFSGCRIPSDNLLGPRGEGLHQFLTILDGGRISGRGARARPGAGRLRARARLCAHAPAVRARDLALPGDPVQARGHGHRDRGRARARPTARPGSRIAGRPFAHEASMAKLYTAELACRVADEAVQIHGGYGYMDEYAVSRFYRDAKILEIGEGTNEIQRLVIARGLGLE